MFVFDILKQDDRRLRPIAVAVAAGMLILLAGLWFVQIVCAKRFQNNLIRQSYRTVHTPAIRGKILDRNGQVLAEDQPRYNAILYLEDLQDQFTAQNRRLTRLYTNEHPEAVTARGRINLSPAMRRSLQLAADCDVVSNITYCVSTSLKEPRVLNTNGFLRHYNDYPYVPFQIVPDLAPRQIAIFAEQLSGQPALELETQPVRVYPYGSLAANLLGYVQRRDDSVGAEISFDMPDYVGVSGVERVCDEELRGQPGVTSVLVNNLNYRQSENIESPNQPGDDVFLTIDLALQRATEKALASAQYQTRGAAIVMDPRNGDILAIASAPTFDPNEFVPGHPPTTPAEAARLEDKIFTPQVNRAVSGAYPPGSTFKIITAIACLESGLDPEEVFDSPGEYRTGPSSFIGDTAGAGKFNFERAFYRSSNTYFIHYGMKAGLAKILEVARRFHLGERTRISTGQEATPGNVPLPESAGLSFPLSSTPDVCIGQEITTTPLQMACVISAIANGGALYWPRVVSHDRSPDTGQIAQLVAQGRLRDRVQIDPRHLDLIRRAMLADTERPSEGTGLAARGGTAYDWFHHDGGTPYLGDFRVAGKTGTAEVKSPGSNYKRITWFDSYGPFENPRYVVVVMVEDGDFGGPTCAPVARQIYQAILKREQSGLPRPATLAHN
ncbi:MAG TPA: penicillin-binding transpeptidase domain-containing protein [Candidatus Baltobacteraceae bacterium]|jgi:penicillin-binding protein 2|nr:penicillin-binding transpeptidase domain-containing protein [Candidatus Baltobacteraceae bacterium]